MLSWPPVLVPTGAPFAKSPSVELRVYFTVAPAEVSPPCRPTPSRAVPTRSDTRVRLRSRNTVPLVNEGKVLSRLRMLTVCGVVVKVGCRLVDSVIPFTGLGSAVTLVM
jgi:hypothetical protein